MLVQDHVSPRGFVSLEVWQGGVLRTFDHPNLITTAGRERFPRLLGGDPTAKRPSQIAIGDNGAAASPGDTAITNALLLPFSAPPTYAATGEVWQDAPGVPPFVGPFVLFSATATQTQGNGLWVREFGLLDDENKLLARWVRGGADLQKANDMRLIVRWAIAF
jgi:hypothetical protein